VIWSGHIGSYEDQAPLLGKYLRKDLVNRGTLGSLVMDEDQQLRPQHTALLPTGVPNGSDEAPRSTRSRRQTRQVPQRIGHEDQTPVFPHGFGAPHARRIEAQVPLTVLIKRFRRPPLRIQADDLRGAPVRPVRHQHDIPARQGLLLTAHHEPDLAQSRDADRQREAPIRVLADFDRALRSGRDQWHQLLHRDVGARELHRSLHDQMARKGMPKVVESQVFNPRPAACRMERFFTS
jgi:hypothetical protein